MRLCTSLFMRNPNKMVKKAIMSSNASCRKEWLVSCVPKGPLLRVVALGSVDCQWGLGVGRWGMFGVGDLLGRRFLS